VCVALDEPLPDVRATTSPLLFQEEEQEALLYTTFEYDLVIEKGGKG
jgi:hypothetical protein